MPYANACFVPSVPNRTVLPWVGPRIRVGFSNKSRETFVQRRSKASPQTMPITMGLRPKRTQASALRCRFRLSQCVRGSGEAAGSPLAGTNQPGLSGCVESRDKGVWVARRPDREGKFHPKSGPRRWDGVEEEARDRRRRGARDRRKDRRQKVEMVSQGK